MPDKLTNKWITESREHRYKQSNYNFLNLSHVGQYSFNIRAVLTFFKLVLRLKDFFDRT